MRLELVFVICVLLDDFEDPYVQYFHDYAWPP